MYDRFFRHQHDSASELDFLLRDCSDSEFPAMGSTGGADFAATIVEAIRAINHGIYPERIPQGSSGSYFVKNLQGEKIGVFKPKNEEPYGLLNPKWIKWLHKLFFPCCFGRSCLLPNQGYLSEAGASLVDQMLCLNVVPKTAVISLAAPTFNYSRVDRAMARTKERIRTRYPDLGRHFRRVGLPPKRGSFQLFVHDFKDAIYWLRQWELYPEQTPPAATMREFQLQFERLIILDYIIRNTDRGNDNWLIRYEPAKLLSEEEEEVVEAEEKQPGTSATTFNRIDSLKRLKQELGSEPVKFAHDGKLIDIQDERTHSTEEKENDKQKQGQTTGIALQRTISEVIVAEDAGDEETGLCSQCWENVSMPNVQIAAIDNGLAFPFKHPDQWRAYPYQWASLPLAQKPFSEDTIQLVLPLIDDTDFVQALGNDLRKIFETDPGFSKKSFSKQLSVIRGQMFNLREALRTRKSPAQLVQMTPQYMIEIKKKKRRKLRKFAKTLGSRGDGERDRKETETTQTHGPTEGSTVVTQQPTTPKAITKTITTTTSSKMATTSGVANVAVMEQPIVDLTEDNEAGTSSSTLVGPEAAGSSHIAATSTTTLATLGTAVCSEQTTTTITNPTGLAPILSEDELDNPKSWHNTFQQKVQTRSPFFAMW